MDSFQRFHTPSSLFQTQESGSDELSLRSHIAKHFSGSDTEQPPSSSSQQADEKPPITFTRPASITPSIPAGHQLYGLDTELQAGIEHLLPTPSVRYRIMKERIQNERSALQKQLEEYRALKSPSDKVQEKVQTLQKKLLTLKRHEAHVDYKIHQMYGSRSWVFQAISVWQNMKSTIEAGQQKIAQALNMQQALHRIDPKRAQLNAFNQRMSYLTQVLDGQLNQKTLHADELADVMNQYDRTAKQAALLQQQLPQDGRFISQVKYLFNNLLKNRPNRLP